MDWDANEDESLSVNVPPPDYTTYAFFKGTTTDVPADAAVRTATRVPEDFRRNAAADALFPDPTVDGAYEGIYEYVDDDAAYLEPSSTYWHESRGFPPRRRVTLPGYRRCKSYDVASRRTLPQGTLLLVDDDDDRHVTGCDVTRSILALDRQGNVFYVPRSSLRRFDDSSGQPWFFPTPMTSHQATVFVAAQHQNGCFVVYRPAEEERSTGGRPEYVLAVGLSQGEAQRHFFVKACQEFFGFQLPSVQLSKRIKKFEIQFS